MTKELKEFLEELSDFKQAAPVEKPEIPSNSPEFSEALEDLNKNLKGVKND